MKKALMLALLTPLLALAAPPPGPPAGRGMGPPPGAPGPGMRPEHERRMRLMMVVGLSDALGLSEAEAVRLADKMKTFDERRRPLRDEMMEQTRILKLASQGDAASLAKVDDAVNRILDGRTKMAQLDKEMFLALGKDLTPQKRAQLALFLGHFKHEMRGRMAGDIDARGGRRFPRRQWGAEGGR